MVREGLGCGGGGDKEGGCSEVIMTKLLHCIRW